MFAFSFGRVLELFCIVMFLAVECGSVRVDCYVAFFWFMLNRLTMCSVLFESDALLECAMGVGGVGLTIVFQVG